jgi:RNA polymerase sigma factor (sigma-70 family)
MCQPFSAEGFDDFFVGFPASPATIFGRDIMDDRELLRQYVAGGSHAAFAELVHRHINLVYAAALRLVREPQAAQDVAQTVFIQLARKAVSLREGNALAGWLYRATCGAAKDSLRTERRRRERESEAVKRADLETDDQALWSSLEPLLDEAMQHLDKTEQNALVLRFLEGKSLRETGHALGLSEDAAQKRVHRALEKLRLHFARHRIVVGSTLIAAAFATAATQAAPAGLSSTVSHTALAAAANVAAGASTAKIALTVGGCVVAVGIALLLFTPSHSGPLAMFRGLGDLPGGEFASYASGLSADGTVVVGMSISSNGQEAFRWTLTNGMVGLGDLPGGIVSSRAAGVSADGTAVAGTSSSASGPEAFRWTQPAGMVGLGDLPGDRFQSAAHAISGDGRVVVGESSSSRGEREAFRWTASEGMMGLGDLPGGSFAGYAMAASADASVIVGTSATTPMYSAFRWTRPSAMIDLGDFPGGATNSNGYGVSPDGAIVVGYGCPGTFDNYTHEAFRWTVASGLVHLGFAPGLSNSAAYAVSADGKIIVGDNKSERIAHALIWDPKNGMRRLEHILTNDYKIDLAGWRLTSARAVSHDGKTIVGSGINPDGKNEAWIVTFKSPLHTKGTR